MLGFNVTQGDKDFIVGYAFPVAVAVCFVLFVMGAAAMTRVRSHVADMDVFIGSIRERLDVAAARVTELEAEMDAKAGSPPVSRPPETRQSIRASSLGAANDER